MRLILAIALAAALLVSAGCGAGPGGTAGSSKPVAPTSRSLTPTEAIAGTWRAVDATPLVQLDFSPGGIVKQQLSRNGQVFTMSGSWHIESAGRIFTSEARLGVPNVHAAYTYRIEGDHLTLSWIEEKNLPGRQPSEPVPWLAGTNHPTVTLTR